MLGHCGSAADVDDIARDTSRGGISCCIINKVRNQRGTILVFRISVSHSVHSVSNLPIPYQVMASPKDKPNKTPQDTDKELSDGIEALIEQLKGNNLQVNMVLSRMHPYDLLRFSFELQELTQKTYSYLVRNLIVPEE